MASRFASGTCSIRLAFIAATAAAAASATATRGVRVRSEGDGIAKGITRGGRERERDGRGGWRADPRVAAVAVAAAMLAVTAVR